MHILIVSKDGMIRVAKATPRQLGDFVELLSSRDIKYKGCTETPTPTEPSSFVIDLMDGQSASHIQSLWDDARTIATSRKPLIVELVLRIGGATVVNAICAETGYDDCAIDIDGTVHVFNRNDSNSMIIVDPEVVASIAHRINNKVTKGG